MERTFSNPFVEATNTLALAHDYVEAIDLMTSAIEDEPMRRAFRAVAEAIANQLVVIERAIFEMNSEARS